MTEIDDFDPDDRLGTGRGEPGVADEGPLDPEHRQARDSGDDPEIPVDRSDVPEQLAKDAGTEVNNPGA